MDSLSLLSRPLPLCCGCHCQPTCSTVPVHVVPDTPDRGRVVTVVGDLVLHRRQDASQTTAHQNLKARRAQQEGREQEKREDHRGEKSKNQL